MSTYAAPDAVGGAPPPGGMLPPGPGAPGSMADIAAALGIDPSGGGGGAPTPGGPLGTGDANTDLLTGMSSTDHIRAAIKHLMMAMTESSDDEESAGITKGMTGLQAILAGKAKNAKVVSQAGG